MIAGLIIGMIFGLLLGMAIYREGCLWQMQRERKERRERETEERVQEWRRRRDEGIVWGRIQ